MRIPSFFKKFIILFYYFFHLFKLHPPCVTGESLEYSFSLKKLAQNLITKHQKFFFSFLKKKKGGEERAEEGKNFQKKKREKKSGLLWLVAREEKKRTLRPSRRVSWEIKELSARLLFFLLFLCPFRAPLFLSSFYFFFIFFFFNYYY